MAAATTDRLGSMAAAVLPESSAVASPRATSTTSSIVRASPLTITFRMQTCCHGGRHLDRAAPAAALDPVQAQQPCGDGCAEGTVQMRFSLRPVQAGAGEA